MLLRSVMDPLENALRSNTAAYRHAVQGSAPGECWDFLILTAANEKQAAGYRQELALRERAMGQAGAFFPAIQRTLVVSDPPGRRAGSGGATLGALRGVINRFGLETPELERARILLIHSGGASQRLPAYSPVGKIFAPLPLLRPDGHIATLFDHLYVALAGLPARLGPGMLVMAGDVFLLFDQAEVTPPVGGVTAISMRVEAELGRGHGVFVTDAAGRITHTLQKAPVEQMQKAGATDAEGRVLIDTGLLHFDARRTDVLAELAGARGQKKRRRGLDERHSVQIDLYEDITGALASGTDRKSFLAAGDSRPVRQELWSALRGTPFQIMQLEGQFLHLGTTRQFRDAMVGRNPSPAAELFQRNVLAHSDSDLPHGVRVYHSVLRSGTDAGALGHGSVVEQSILAAGSRIGDGSVVSQVIADARPIDLGKDLLLFQSPVRDRHGKLLFVQVACGIDDDFKAKCGDDRCNYLNRPLEEWLQRHGISAAALWPRTPAENRTLWTARLFVATRRRDSAQAAIALSSDRTSKAAINAWRKANRYSMAMVLEQSDPGALIEHREIVSAALQAEEVLRAIEAEENTPLESNIGRFTTLAAYAEAGRLLEGFAAPLADDPKVAMMQARALWCAAQLLQRPDHRAGPKAVRRAEALMRRAFGKVAEASEVGHRRVEFAVSADAGAARELPAPGLQVTASAPVRLDLAGGWTDTPPYCFECGGSVVNVALDLDGRPPISAIVQTISEPRLILESRDLGQTVDASRMLMKGAEIDVRDPFALHQVAIGLAGLFPNEGMFLRKQLKSRKVGLKIITESRVPKGSGLGASSILAAALLAALHRVLGREPALPALIEQTLLLEQRLSTGGGWQDQVGGLVGGIKSTLTGREVPQRPVIEELDLGDEQLAAFEQRLVVYYSGQQRLARDVLRRVMGRWLGREPAMRSLTDALKDSAASLRAALLQAAWTEAGTQIARYWQIKKDLFPGSTTPAIDLLLQEMQADCLAGGLAGAGGGGFAYFLCNDAAQADRLQARLADYSARPGLSGGVYAAKINRTGLVVNTSRG